MQHDVRTIIIQRKCSVDMTIVGLTQALPQICVVIFFNSVFSE